MIALYRIWAWICSDWCKPYASGQSVGEDDLKRAW